MTDALRVRDLFDIPERVHQGDFVLKLTEGLSHPEETAALYVATPDLVDAFDRALGLIGDALSSGQSKATYLHGSFGSGKSHFMAMLSLLLSGHEAAWRIPELHGLREKHAYAGKRRLLELHFHMIGAETLESKLFSTYLQHVREHHPEAELPGLFADEELFDNARTTLSRVGAERFFAEMGGEKKGWGKHGAGWTQERFDEHAASTDPRERAKLFSALVKSWFPAYTSQGSYLDLDEGLAVLARHAHELGYAGVVLFLDELILWLSHRASEHSWLNRETEKMIKLVEAQQSDRAIPIVSFVARQRSLGEMVGKMYTGADERILNDLLDHAQGRFDTITLEDKNLPAIVEKRILKPKGDAGKAQLDAAFEQLQRTAGRSWETLLGDDEPGAFRKLYPFSPALVDALVKLSNSLQRQRTAIKLLLELLSEHVEDLKLGEVVRVGDLYDVLAGGEEPTDGVMRSLFRSAKQLYDYQFLPVLQESNGTHTPERCQRLRPGHPKRLGCSNCPEQQCRADNRLIKTLLIAALVPQVKVLKDLTVSRLFRLNHGSLRVAVPGMEASLVVQKLRQWGAQNLPLFVGNEKDPTVQVRLEGVDLKPILQKYAGEDSPGSRQRILRDLLFDALGLERVTDTGTQETTTWHQTARQGRILFGNVRSLSAESLRCPPDHDFRLVVDYPFDEPGKTPSDDLEAMDRFMERESSWTLVWLPHFFSEASSRILGDLAILEHIFSHSEVKRQAVAHLSVEDQSRALNDMDNQRNQKKNRLLDVIAQAYGLYKPSDSDISTDHRVDQHLVLLYRGAAAVQPSLAANLSSAKEAFLHALLDRRYPNHPRFSQPLSPQRIERMYGKFAELLTTDEKRLPAERELAREMAGTLGELGLVRATEGYVHLVADKKLQEIENKRLAEGLDRPTVDEVRVWVDPKGLMGLPEKVLDLVVRCYAVWSQRTVELNGKPYEPPSNRPLPGQAILERPDLPEPAEWAQAIIRAGQCFGISLPGNYRGPDNLMKLHALLEAKLASATALCAALPTLLAQRGAIFDLGDDTDRARTARSADRLGVTLSGKSPADRVRALAGAPLETSPSAVGRHLGQAGPLKELLSDRLIFGVFEQLRARVSELPGAAELVEEAASAFRQDEIHVALVERLKNLAGRGQDLLRPAHVSGNVVLAPVVVSGKVRVSIAEDQLTASGRAEIAKSLAGVAETIRAKVDASAEELELHVSWRLTRKG